MLPPTLIAGGTPALDAILLNKLTVREFGFFGSPLQSRKKHCSMDNESSRGSKVFEIFVVGIVLGMVTFALDGIEEAESGAALFAAASCVLAYALDTNSPEIRRYRNMSKVRKKTLSRDSR